MAITVYPRLGELLRERKMSVAELARQIEARWGRSVDPKTLYRLTADEPIKRVDIDIVFEIAAVLELRLEELFDILALTPEVEFFEEERADDLLTAAEDRRMGELFSLEDERGLTRAERKELKALVNLYGLRQHERNIRLIAEQRDVSYEQAEVDVAASLAEALEWWRVNEKRIRCEIAAGMLPTNDRSQTKA
jgi:DNA-binding Xre family transcriptional regulator